MKIYTKTGDSGTTSLISGKRVPKNHLRIEAYGTTDELISNLSLLHDSDISPDYKAFLEQVLNDLMTIASILATDNDEYFEKIPKLSSASVVKLENEIDRLEQRLEPIKSFIIPGGHTLVSTCHVVRTVCRRCERRVYALHEAAKVPETVLIYLNRLSDYLFVLARAVADDLKIKDIIWKPTLD